tara:strand:- start:525 stop:728 length:204 start_codon:yes stop_codon:yes gene_type:complete
MTYRLITCPRCDSIELHFKKGAFECDFCGQTFCIGEKEKLVELPYLDTPTWLEDTPNWLKWNKGGNS